MDVHLHQNTGPCRHWSLDIRKLGGRLHVVGFMPAMAELARARAEEFAAFLGVPLVVEPAAPESQPPSK